ncbi:2Fe-2S iron-sulfur cluster-binding protein [Streptomyces sp. NPDC056169]|uniref:2Fe-2S iron-sulfur cluster-binding protein n=1 Tax=Streptomyces sp. NPDC056169 TaxID=3345734 RepID=UPI0035D88AAD
MSNDEQHGNPGGWEPIPQSEGYDGDATAFVQLPPDFMLDGVPLEAPGHGYVPPMIMPLQPLTPAAATDPAATGAWTVHLPTQAEQVQHFDQVEHVDHVDRVDHVEHVDRVEHAGQAQDFGQGQGTEYFEQGEYVQHGSQHAEGFGQDPHATAEWNFAGSTASVDSTGQWEIPVAPEQAVPEQVVPESAVPETAAAEAVEPPHRTSYDQAPATLPGGAPAPWALPEEPVAEAGQADADAVQDASGPEPEREPEPDADAPAEIPVEALEETAPAPVPEPDPAPDVYASTDSDEHPHTSYTLRVNGADRPVTGSWIGESLLYVLRERLGLAGAKDGCSQGECGACNVQVDGRLVASCLVPAATAAGSEVRTVEGLATDGEPSDVQRAMAKCGTVQCGFCIPGMCMTVHDLLEGNHAPTELETRQALAGNLCRCSGYRGVLEAVRDVVAEREASAAATAPTGPEAAAELRVPHQIPHPHDGGMA